MGKVNDFKCMGEAKVALVAEYIPMYEWENYTNFTTIKCVWCDEAYTTQKGLEALPAMEARVLRDILLDAALYMVGVSRYKYVDYLNVEATVTKDGITLVASASSGEDGDEDFWYHDDVTFTLPYSFTLQRM